MLLLLLQCEKILRHPFNNLRYLNRYVSQMTTILFRILAKITVNDWHNTHLAFFPYLKQLNLGKMKFLMNIAGAVFRWSTCCGFFYPKMLISLAKSTLNMCMTFYLRSIILLLLIDKSIANI